MTKTVSSGSSLVFVLTTLVCRPENYAPRIMAHTPRSCTSHNVTHARARRTLALDPAAAACRGQFYKFNLVKLAVRGELVFDATAQSKLVCVT